MSAHERSFRFGYRIDVIDLAKLVRDEEVAVERIGNDTYGMLESPDNYLVEGSVRVDLRKVSIPDLGHVDFSADLGETECIDRAIALGGGYSCRILAVGVGGEEANVAREVGDQDAAA